MDNFRRRTSSNAIDTSKLFYPAEFSVGLRGYEPEYVGKTADGIDHWTLTLPAEPDSMVPIGVTTYIDPSIASILYDQHDTSIYLVVVSIMGDYYAFSNWGNQTMIYAMAYSFPSQIEYITVSLYRNNQPLNYKYILTVLIA